MRILILTWEYPPYVVGGMGKHVAGLVPALAALRNSETPVQIDVVTTRYGGGASVERLTNQVTIHRIDMSPFDPVDIYNTVIDNNQFFVDYVKTLAQQQPFDLIHIHDWLTGVAGIMLKYEFKIPLVVTMHATERGRHQGNLTSATSNRIDRLEWQICHEAWRVIVCSHFMTSELNGYFSTPYNKMYIIPNGIAADELHVIPERQHALLTAEYAPNHERLLFFVGRIVHEKGVHVLIRAMPEILQDYPDTRLLVAGRNSRHLYPLAAELGVAHAVRFLDFITDQQRDWIYQVVDAAVFPSLYEPFGIVALEAMALDCNVIASDVGGLGEVVKHEVNGLTVYPGNPASIAWAVRRLFDDPDAAKVRRIMAHAQVGEQYSWHTIALQTATLYRAVVEERKHVVW